MKSHRLGSVVARGGDLHDTRRVGREVIRGWFGDAMRGRDRHATRRGRGEVNGGAVVTSRGVCQL